MKKILSLCSVVALSATVSAQSPTVTMPAGYLKTSGNYYQWGAFRYSQGRHQTLYSPNAAGTTAAGFTINTLFLRADEGTATSGLASFVREWEVVVSSKGSKWSAPTKTTWAGNHGTDKVVFMAKKKFNLPAVAKAATTPLPWSGVLKGDKPFIVAKGEGLVVDVKSYGTTYTYTGWYTDAINDTSNDTGSYSSVGTGCPSTFYHYSGYYYVGATNPWYTYGYSRGLGDFVFTWLGTSKTNIKVTTSCNLFTIPVVMHPKIVKTTSTTGYTGATADRHVWGKIPASLGGKKLVSQMGAVDSKGALKLSRGIEITFGKGPVTPKGTKVVYGYGNGYNPDTAVPKYGPYTYGVIFGRN